METNSGVCLHGNEGMWLTPVFRTTVELCGTKEQDTGHETLGAEYTC